MQIDNEHYRVTWEDADCAHELALLDGGLPGILNHGSIESALARPYHGYHALIHEKAAALMHGLISNHGFVDGNKRTALYLVELLVQRSGYVFIEDDEAVVDMVVDVARGEVDDDDLADWIESRLVRIGEHHE